MRLNFRLKDYVSRQYGLLNGGMVILQLLLDVFTQRNFVADFHSIKIEFYLNNRFLSHLLGDLGVTYALHL